MTVTDNDLRDLVATNLTVRAELLAKCEHDVDMQQFVLEKCRRDPVYFINNFIWTYNPKFPPGCNNIPMQLYGFQEWAIYEFVKTIDEQEDFVIEKSRDVGASWMLLMVFLWMWLFRKDLTFLIGSMRESEVDTGGPDPQTLFGKIRYAVERLPNWFLNDEFWGLYKARGSSINKQFLLRHPINNCYIKGATGNAKFGRGSRYTAMLFDELAYWEEGSAAWNGSQQTSRCRIAVSTPNSDGNMFYQVAHWPNIENISHPLALDVAKAKGLVRENIPF